MALIGHFVRFLEALIFEIWLRDTRFGKGLKSNTECRCKND